MSVAQQIVAPTTAAEVLNNDGSKPASEPLPNSTPASPDRLAPKFEALLKRERSAVDRERHVKTQEEQLQQKLREIEEREKKLNEFYSIKDKNPTKALELLGLSYQDLTNIMLNDGVMTPDVEIKKVETKLDSYLKEQELKEQRRLEDEKRSAEAREQQMITEFKSEISNYIKENADRYELISFENSEELVYDVIDGHYEKTKNPETGEGEILTIAQAADKVEEYLEKKYDKARTLKKMQAFLAPKPDQKQAQQINTESLKPKTLTNQVSANHSTPRPGVITDDERIRRAINYALSLKK